MTLHDEVRIKELLAWAVRFANMKIDPRDVRYQIQVHVSNIAEHIRQQPNISLFSDKQILQLATEREQMITQLDILHAKTITVAVAAKLEQQDEARKQRAEARKKGALTEQRVKESAALLRAEGVPEHKLITAILKATGLSRGCVRSYLAKK